MASILSLAVKGSLTAEEINRIVKEKAFLESPLTILPALENEQWQLLDSAFRTPLIHQPSMPLTTLQKRWIKAISLDPKMKLFGVDFDFLCDIQPLFTPEDFVVFDQYNDGDPFEDQNYRRVFRILLDAIRSHKRIKIQYFSRKGNHRTVFCVPYKIEYSEKDDKFRVLISSCRFANILNVGCIQECELLDDSAMISTVVRKSIEKQFILELKDERNALERVMLHFAHFKKEAERICANQYRMKLYYDQDDETELVIRVLSFGPLVKVTEPAAFVGLIKERLIMQKEIGVK